METMPAVNRARMPRRSNPPLRRGGPGLTLSLVLLLTACALQGGAGAGGEPALPAHHTPEGFRNPYPVDDRKRSFFSYWRMRLFEERFADHEAVAHRMPAHTVDPSSIDGPADAPRLTWIGHATFLIQHRGTNLLTDPHFSDRASPFSFAGPRRLVPLPLALEQLPPIHYVVISHNHYDQLDRKSVQALGSRPRWLVPLGLRQTLVEWGVDPERITELDWWQRHDEPGLSFTSTPAHHWSARTLFDRNETLWSSWMVEMEGFRFWFAGDTAYNPVQFREIGAHFPAIDLALIPIGGYAPRWFMQEAHVSPEEALQIHRDLGARRSYGMHWGTFQLTAEPMFEPAERLQAAVADAPAGTPPFETLAIGETVTLDGDLSIPARGRAELP